jgi:hypothetical protein
MRTEYNLPQAMSRCLHARIALVLLLALAATGYASERWETQVSVFAKKIAAISGPGTATLEVRNLSALPAEQAEELRRALESQLGADGVQIRPAHEASVGIRVTLAENRRGWLWIAEIQQGTETRVTMLELPENRAQKSAASELPILQGSLLLNSEDVLLDAQPLRAPQGVLAALTTHSVKLFEEQGGRWQPLRELPIPLQLTLPLDPRGRIVPAADHPFDLYLPGENCAAAGDSANALALSCIASDDPWPLDGQTAFYNSARNYFTGVLVPGVGPAMPPFFSAASIAQGKDALWIFAGIDGQVLSFDGTSVRPLTGAAHEWGSDLAAVRSGCGSGAQLLATQSGPGVPTDSVQAFEIAEREPLAASTPLNFDGSITALWATAGGSAATVIVHTAQGGYDAYSVSLACTR